MKSLLIVWSAFLVLMMFLPAQAGQGDSESLASELRTTSIEKRRTAAAGVKESRKVVIEMLRGLANETAVAPLSEDSTKEIAIDLLGEYRAESAIDDLVQQISYRVSTIELEETPAAGYPCVHALAKIGNRAIPAIFQRLTESVTREDLVLFAFTIRIIDGDEVGAYRIELALRDSRGTKKRNLSQLLDIYRNRIL
jgi:hypothetical protein